MSTFTLPENPTATDLLVYADWRDEQDDPAAALALRNGAAWMQRHEKEAARTDTGATI